MGVGMFMKVRTLGCLIGVAAKTNSDSGVSIILKPTLSPLLSLWSLSQRRGAKTLGSEVRTGNIVQRKGRIFQVLKAQHTQHGRGGASIQVELRDVDSGNKVTERFRTDEAIEKVYVEEKTFQYLYSEEDMVVLTDPETFEQLEVPKELFGKSVVYLKEDMTIRVQYYDGRPMSTTVPYRVTCTVVEAQAPMKGLSVNPQYKKVLLDNGLTILVMQLWLRNIAARGQQLHTFIQEHHQERIRCSIVHPQRLLLTGLQGLLHLFPTLAVQFDGSWDGLGWT